MMEPRKKKDDDAEEGAPAWMMTFGDLMTLLLTFFVLLFSMSTISEKKFAEVLGSLETYFGVGANVTSPDPPTPEQIIETLLNYPPDRPSTEAVATDEVVEGLFLKVVTLRSGVKIVIGGKALFERDSAALPPEAIPVLREIARLINGYRNRIRVVGHTEPSEEVDLWRLSYDRAETVRRFLIGVDGIADDEGREQTVGEDRRIHPARMEVVAAAAMQPSTSNLGEGAPLVAEPGGPPPVAVGKRFNRRVEIIVTEELVPWNQLR